MLPDTLKGGFGNSVNIWFLHNILNFFPFELLTKHHQNGEFLRKNIVKSTSLEIPKLPSTEKAMYHL